MDVSAINGDGTLSHSSGADTIVVGDGTDFHTGDRVFYHTNGTPIGGLANDTYYYVITTSDSRLIQLAATLADTTTHPAPTQDDPNHRDPGANPIALTPDTSDAGKIIKHELVRESVGGLQSGVTYYVQNDDGTKFQLLSTPDPADIIAITPPSSAGGAHDIFKAGADLTATSGEQELRIDLTMPAAA